MMHFHVSNNFTVHEAPGSDKAWKVYNAGGRPGVACSADDCYACDCTWLNRKEAAPETKRTNINGPPCAECKSTDKHCSCDNGDHCNGLQITFTSRKDGAPYCLSCAVKRGMLISACRCP